MNPKEQLIAELLTTSENLIRSELAVHDIHPSSLISKDILINMLIYVYFGEG